jgi:hypothetical protein
MAYPSIQYTGEKLSLAPILRHVTHYEPTTISAALNLALRARGLSKTSCFVGVSGFGVKMRRLAL